jgi:hypothetical protein
MSVDSAIELRLELFSEGKLPASLTDRITQFLAEWWPETWDVKVPEQPSLEHPAEWRAVVPLPDGATPENLHGRVEAELSALDPAGSLHYRTRWAFQESPNHQEVYEVRWSLKKS